MSTDITKVLTPKGLSTDQSELVINRNTYKDLGVFENVSICLPRYLNLRYVKPYFEIVKKGDTGDLVQVMERFNRSNKKANIHPKHTIAYNYFAEIDTEKNAIFSIQDPEKMPLGNVVLAKVKIVLKTNGVDESIIVNVYVYDNQENRQAKWFYKESTVPSYSGAKTFLVPGENYLRIHMKPFKDFKR